MKNKISSLLNKLNRVKSSLDNKNVSFVCLGLYNHGKSSLLNALIDDYNDETFKVNIIKETSSIKKIVNDNITFIDTPGLNENMQDDETTLGENILESDVYLFVHSCANGELNIQEINYLKKINFIFDDVIDRTIFILTKTDSISDIGKMENKIKDQLLQIFKGSPDIVSVASLSYKKGKKENKLLLTKKSNIDFLKRRIVAKKNSIFIARKKRVMAVFDKTIQSVQFELNELRKKKNIFLDMCDGIDEDLKYANTTLKQKYTKLS